MYESYFQILAETTDLPPGAERSGRGAVERRGQGGVGAAAPRVTTHPSEPCPAELARAVHVLGSLGSAAGGVAAWPGPPERVRCAVDRAHAVAAGSSGYDPSAWRPIVAGGLTFAAALEGIRDGRYGAEAPGLVALLHLGALRRATVGDGEVWDDVALHRAIQGQWSASVGRPGYDREDWAIVAEAASRGMLLLLGAPPVQAAPAPAPAPADGDDRRSGRIHTLPRGRAE